MQGDAMSLRAASEVALFRGWTSVNQEVERARSLMEKWDGTLARDSAAAAIHSAWRSASSTQERETSRPAAERKPQHEASLAKAVEQLKASQGTDWSAWRWGRMHTRSFQHPLIPNFDLPTVERPGGTGSLAADGASYREIMDVSNWDQSIATNVPGQSAQPGSPFYSNLLKLWADDVYFPLVYTRGGVDKAAAHKLVLRPR
jgi:penicillin amidase